MQEHYADTNADIVTELTQLRSLQQTAKTNQEVAATNLITANDNLAMPDIFTDNQQTVNAIQLEVWAGILPVLESSEISILEQIVYQCPLEGGNAVHRARAMLRGIGEYNFKGVNCASNATTRPESKNTPMVEQHLRVFPNPAQQRTLQVQLPVTKQSAKLQLSNLQGQVLRVWSVDKEQHQLTITIEGVPDGFYLLQWSDGEHTISTKLILQ